MKKFLLLILLAGCYEEPKQPNPICDSVMVPGDGVRCVPFTIQEQITREAFNDFTRWSLARTSEGFTGWGVVAHKDPKWDQDRLRWYWTQEDIPDFKLWGLTRLATKTVELADLSYEKAVMAHEDCHVLGVVAHADWPVVGCDKVESAVREKYPHLGQELVAVEAQDFGDTFTLNTSEGPVRIHGVYAPSTPSP